MDKIEGGDKFIVYRITNLINGKEYIGKHQTKNINDSYMGSGKLITSAIKKYGVEHFKKEILFVYSTAEEANKKEAELVTPEYIVQEDTYNLTSGGLGGFYYINKHPLSSQWHKKAGKKTRTWIGQEAWKYIREHDPERKESWRKKISQSEKGRPGYFKGKHHSEETKKKMSQVKKGKQTTSTLGKSWYTNGKENVLCFPDKIPEGFSKGRKIK